jgi:hypothetical protein
MNTTLAIYLSIGATIWLLAALTGSVDRIHGRLIDRVGKTAARRITVLATFYSVLFWPWYLALIFRTERQR